MRSFLPCLPCCFLVLATLLAGAPADARCRSSKEVLRFARDVEAALDCAQRSFSERSGARRCRPQSPPSCAVASFDAIVELTLGATPPLPRSAADRRKAARGRETAQQARCQRAVLRGARDYVRDRVHARLRGRRGARRGPLLRDVARACEDVATLPLGAQRLPGVAGACAPLYGDGAAPDAHALARCLTASLEGAIDRVVPRPLRPNLVLILTDDQRADSLDWMPQTLERLADRGVRFDNGFVTTPVCGPSRVSILTGQYARRHGVLTNGHFPDPAAHRFDEDASFGRWLQAAGYRTAFLGKYVNGDDARDPTIPRGWDHWQVFRNARFYGYTLNVNGTLETFGDGPADYSTDVLTDRAVSFIRASRNEPFLLVLSLFAPHTPAVAAARHAHVFSGIPPARPPSFREANLSGKPQWIRFLRTLETRPEQVDALRIAQLETLPAVDDAVGSVLDALDRFGLTDNTAVVFTSDNGYHWGEHWWTSKFTGYEESLRVPFVVRYPVAQPVGRRSDAIALNIDIAPTFADLARARPMVPVDGESLRPLLEGEPPRREDFAFESFDAFVVRPMEGVRDGRHKLIVTSPTAATPFLELYDLVDDPFELSNRAGDPGLSDVVERMRARLPAILATDP